MTGAGRRPALHLLQVFVEPGEFLVEHVLDGLFGAVAVGFVGQEHQADGSYLVRFFDLRYVDPDRSTIPLTAEVLLNDKLEVIGERFGGFGVRWKMRPARR